MEGAPTDCQDDAVMGIDSFPENGAQAKNAAATGNGTSSDEVKGSQDFMEGSPTECQDDIVMGIDSSLETGAQTQTAAAPRDRISSDEVKGSQDLRKLFGAQAAARSRAVEDAAVIADFSKSVKAELPSQPLPTQTQSAVGVMGAFNLRLSRFQDLDLSNLGAPADMRDRQLEASVMNVPVALSGIKDVVPLLLASTPLLPSGRAIFARLPQQWVDLFGRCDALGTRCLFTSRRHEHSVFEHLEAGRYISLPRAAQEWQPSMQVPADCLQADGSGEALASEEAWLIQAHPGRGELCIAVRPGVLLARMLRAGTALPTASFTWRLVDSSQDGMPGISGINGLSRGLATDMGEFSILCNVEDAAHTQPPRFLEFPLRIEQLRSLGWMILQERRRREPFVTELRQTAPLSDAPHLRLEGSLRCEYRDVKGGVLADAIGYGKTACTIGLIDCTAQDPPPEVSSHFRGFIPTRATLVLAPTNLHSQWLEEIKKFTGTALKVLSIPTCAQLKKLPPQEIMEADVVVATYRLFYSSPYLQRLQEISRERHPDFSFPRLPQSAPSAEWAKAYRKAFETLPAWAANIQGPQDDPVTPAKLKKPTGVQGQEVTPEVQTSQSSQSQVRRVIRGKQKAAEYIDMPYSQDAATSPAQEVPPASKRRRHDKNTTEHPAGDGPVAVPTWSTAPQYIPLEAFWWKRVVCDEFHELLSKYPPAQVAVELFHADYKWGLSGTPPCQALGQIRKAAGFFGVQIPTAAAVDDGGEAPRKVAQEWLDAFVRRNTAELPTMEEEERIIRVHLAPKERALYTALTEQRALAASSQQDNTLIAEGSLPNSLQEPPELSAARTSSSGLLKLCSHFCPSGAAEVLCAEDECERQLALRREQVRAVEREIRGHIEKAASTIQIVRHFLPHYCRTPDRVAHCHTYGFLEKESRSAIAARLKFLGAATNGPKTQLLPRLFEVLGDSSTPEAVKDMALRVDFNPKAAGLASKMCEEKTPSWKSLEALAKESVTEESLAEGKGLVARIVREVLTKVEAGGVPQRCIRFRSSQGMPRWPGSINTESIDAAVKRKDLEQANWDWLSDPDHASSFRLVMAGWKADVERLAAKALELEAAATLKLQSLQSFSGALQASQCAPVDDLSVAEEVPTAKFAKYGSKIEALVKHMLRLQAEDPTCKAICFVQWEDLKCKIGDALKEFGIEHLVLHGSVWARRAALMRFQYEADSPRMLLLSLEESASGTNLTAANHVLIVHPMEAATRDEAVAFEMQAVGRVRRPGQQRKIHIWRFVTVGTVEQEISEEHQNELWERQQAAVMLSQAIMESQQFTVDLMQPEMEEEINQEASTQQYEAMPPLSQQLRVDDDKPPCVPSESDCFESSLMNLDPGAPRDSQPCGADSVDAPMETQQMRAPFEYQTADAGDSSTQLYLRDQPLEDMTLEFGAALGQNDMMPDSDMADPNAETQYHFPPVPLFEQRATDDCTQQY